MIDYEVKVIKTDKVFISDQQISLKNTTVTGLTIPTGATYAIIRFESDATATDSTKAVRVRFGGLTPTTSVGMPFGNLETIEIAGTPNLEGFRAVSIESTKTTVITIWYFK